MKKVLILACAALTACTNDIDLGPEKGQVETLSNAIGFQMAKKNMTTTKASTLQDAKHYNFGVWGYKAVTGSAVPTIMENYLVGFGGTNVGYKMDASNQTTWGDATASTANGKSQWAYENLGSSEYNYTGDDGFYKSSQTSYMSNIANQYLRYWDQSAASTKFFAYAPYLNVADVDKRVKFDYNSDQTMTLPLSERKVEKGEDESLAEYMVATQQVEKANYNNDVQLHFRRLNAKVNIKFYETIEGYNVKIVDLKSGVSGVTAVPAVATTTAGSTSYTYGTQYKSTEVKVKFNNITTTTGTSTPDINYQATSATKYASPEYMTFTAPSGPDVCSTEGYISGKGVYIGSTEISDDATARANASKSPSTYFVIPKQAGNDSGLTFHVTYELTAPQTGEKITVHNATVHVPATNCAWEAGKAYTYIFMITKNSNGSTDPSKPIDPADPTPDPDKALYPIVFDGCTVIAWENETPMEHEITDGTFNYYLTLSASTLSKGTGATPITVNAYKTDGTNTFAAAGELKIFDSSNADKTSDFEITTSTGGAAPKISTTAAANDTYTLKYTSGTKELTATFTVTE